MHRLSFRPSARIAGPDLFMHLRRVAAQRTADFYFFYVDAGLVVFLNAIQTRLVVRDAKTMTFPGGRGWRGESLILT
jgi:hypothetical protein